MHSKWAWAGYVLLSLIVIGSLVRCGLFGSVVSNVATDCGPELISEVAEILARDSWQADLAAKARTLGVSAIACAVRSVLKSVSDGSSATPGAKIVNLPATEDRRQMIRKRADTWLAQHKGR